MTRLLFQEPVFQKPDEASSAYAYSEADFDGYSAAPLLIVGGNARPELIEAQDRLADNFVNAVHGELDSLVKPGVVSFVAHSITSRMQQREGLNGVSYTGRAYAKPNYTQARPHSVDAIDEACEAICTGSGTVLQNEIARRALGMQTAEYANLTVIGEFRKHLESSMWDDVSELVGEDATPHYTQMYGIKFISFDRDINNSAHIGAMRIGMKRIIGRTSFGATVKGRTTAIINMSPSTGVGTELIDEFVSTHRERKPIDELPSFQNAVRWLVETNLPEGLVLARNETVYGVDESSY